MPEENREQDHRHPRHSETTTCGVFSETKRDDAINGGQSTCRAKSLNGRTCSNEGHSVMALAPHVLVQIAELTLGAAGSTEVADRHHDQRHMRQRRFSAMDYHDRP